MTREGSHVCYKTECPDELSFQKTTTTTYQRLSAICNYGIEFDNYNETDTT